MAWIVDIHRDMIDGTGQNIKPIDHCDKVILGDPELRMSYHIPQRRHDEQRQFGSTHN
jgi:hypothetical protein